MLIHVTHLNKNTRMTMIESPPTTFPAPGPHWTMHARSVMVEVVKSVLKRHSTVYFKGQVLLFILVFRVGTAAPAKPVFFN